MIKKSFLVAVALFVSGCANSLPPLKTVENLDLKSYMGQWYVIASIPAPIEKNAYNEVESYNLLSDGSINTVLTFNDGGFNGVLKRYNPRGFVIDKINKSTWGMRFVWPFKAQYLITYLSPDNSQTIVGRDKRDYFWIMARTSQIPDADYQRLFNDLKTQGYDVTKARKVPHQ